jgi:hypothetical protein
MTAITITETKKSTRPNTSVDFYSATASHLLPAEFIDAFKANGSVVASSTVSDDGLTETAVRVFTGLDVYSAIDTAIGLNVDSSYIDYSTTNSFITINRPDQYVQSGITQPFACVTTYTFPDTCAEIDTISGWITGQNETSSKLANLTVTGTTVRAIHNYSDSGDFTLHHFSDFHFVKELAAAGAVRTITYQLL